jgi:iron complex outermembrane receptor protein
MQGVKLKNSFDLAAYKLLVGVDTSKRIWKGEYVNNVSGMVLGKSIDKALTKNLALFSTLEKQYGNFNVKLGLRLDTTTLSNDNVNHQDNDYNGINANIFTTYALNSENKFFAGFGQASRVPDGRELYFQKGAATIGTPNLKQTTNREFDLGYETDNDIFKLKIKGFYSMLYDYIYYQKALASNNFKNIDATVYGAELTASYYINDDATLDMGASYKRGKKENALMGQSDKDLADMAPLRANVAVNYEYANNSLASIEMLVSDKWNNYDADNGEQALAAWAVVNLKLKHAVNKKFDFSIGLNNAFNRTYAQSNTYADLNLIVSGTTGDVMLLKEPGRYFYTNLDFKF